MKYRIMHHYNYGYFIQYKKLSIIAVWFEYCDSRMETVYFKTLYDAREEVESHKTSMSQKKQLVRLVEEGEFTPQLISRI